jgi:hypothetical protein
MFGYNHECIYGSFTAKHEKGKLSLPLPHWKYEDDISRHLTH